MKKVRKLVDRMRKEGSSSSANPLPVVQTSEVTIPAAPPDVLDEDFKGWAEEAEVELTSVDGVWWRYGDLEGVLAPTREGNGFVGLQLHGGGYIIGSAKDVMSGGSRVPRGFIEKDICACVLSVDYSLVGQGDEPNHPFPTQILEALSAYYYIVRTLNVPPKQIILIGDSAGGHLTLALQRYLLQSNVLPPPGALILLSPWCDLTIGRTITHREYQNPHIRRLLGPRASDALSTPYFSPALHQPPQHWPPTLVYYSKTENFVSAIVMLISQLTSAGVRIASFASEDIPERFAHDFLILVTAERGWPQEVQKCWKRIKTWTKELEAA